MRLTVIYNEKNKINFSIDKELEERQKYNVARKLMKERLPQVKKWDLQK